MDEFNDTVRPIVTANMAAVTCMSILYGATLLMYPACLYVLLGQRSKGQPIHWILVSCVTIQFVALTFEVSVQEAMMFKSFVGLADRPDSLVEIALYWSLPNTALFKIANICALINIAIGDAIFVWRVWILFHSNALLICVPPIITHVSSTVCGIVMIHSIWRGTTPEFIRHIATAAWVLGMTTQGYSTSVIAWKIWNAGVANSKAGNSQSGVRYYKAIIAVVVQSGAIYTALVLPLTVTFAIGSSASIVISGCLDPIAVLVPASIVILVGRNRNRQFRTTMLSQVIPGVNAGEKSIDGVRGNIVFARSPQNSSIEDDAV